MPDPSAPFFADPALLAAITATFLVAGMVKGITGMGLPTVAMGILGGLISPLTAAGLLILPTLITNLWQLLTGPDLAGLLRRFWPLLVASILGTLIAAPILTAGDPGPATLALGATLLAYALFTLLARPFRVPPTAERWLSPLVGMLTGLVAGATGVSVIPSVPYLQALGLQKDALVQALGLTFTASTLALAVSLAGRNLWQADQLALSALALIPALMGVWAGQRLRRHLSPAAFRRAFLIALALLGAEMVLRPLL